MMEGDEGKAWLASMEEAMATDIKGMKFACIGEKDRKYVTDPIQLEEFDRALDVLRNLGAEITELSDWDCGLTKATAGVIMLSEGYYHNQEIVDDDSKTMDEGVRARLRAGKSNSARAFIGATETRKKLIAKWYSEMGDRVAWLSPTTPERAIALKEVDESTSPATLTRDANFLGLCAMSVPTGPRKDGGGDNRGLPTSLQIACAPSHHSNKWGSGEAMALCIARNYESARGDLLTPPQSA